MIGAIVYRLRAGKPARLPVFHGRLLHGAVFHILHEFSPELAAAVHDGRNSKPFTVSLLKREQRKKEQDRHELMIRAGDIFYWRVTALDEVMLQAFLSLPAGTGLPVGEASFEVEDVIADGRWETGMLDEADLIAEALAVPKVQSIAFEFCSPVSFRNYERDYPFPLPELVFGSLADKWLQNELPVDLDRQHIKEMARPLRLLEWEGKSQKVYFAKDRGMLAFTGQFRFETSILPLECQQLFLMLAQFATFAGVGRLTGQGFGRTRVHYR